MTEICFACRGSLYDGDGLVVVLVLGRVQRVHCSEACARDSVRKQRSARAAARRRWLLGTLFIVASLAAGNTLWHRHRAPPSEVIASGAPEAPPEEPPPGPIYYGPAWPPTDADWTAAFNETSWIYPLPGPFRRNVTIDGRIFGPPPPSEHPARCRREGHCGVDLGGELWGEHVYAVHDGVVDRVQGGGMDERGGQYVRLSHFGGMVFTQYFHLAATPRGVFRGARVKAGDVIGLLGDTGTKGSRRHLHFTLSVRASTDFSETYWDPKPMMMFWPLRKPPHGTVAGLAADEKESETPRRRR